MAMYQRERGPYHEPASIETKPRYYRFEDERFRMRRVLPAEADPRPVYRPSSDLRKKSDDLILNTVCCNCGKYGHEVRDCRKARPDGYRHGCFWCNNATHMTTR